MNNRSKTDVLPINIQAQPVCLDYKFTLITLMILGRIPMYKIRNILLKISVLTIILSPLSACSPNSSGKTEDTKTVKIATLPVIDTLPMYVAEQEGLFTKHDINVQFIPASSAPKRDELVSSAQADGMINEVVSTIFYNRDETQVQIVRYARVATEDSPIFRILSSNKSQITDLNSLKGVEIGVSTGTVIEYLTYRLLQAEGFSLQDINLIAVPDIGQRMALLGSGELDAAMLPDPLASLVISQGANLVLEDSTHPEFSHSVYTFRADFIQENQETLRGFLAAIEDAVDLINEDPQKYNALLEAKELVPQPLIGVFSVPLFVNAGVPTQSQWDDVSAWIQEVGLEVGNATYQNSVTDNYLP